MSDENKNQEQGNELSQEEIQQLKSFHEDMAPIGQHLSEQPKVLKAILDGKINDEWFDNAMSSLTVPKEASPAPKEEGSKPQESKEPSTFINDAIAREIAPLRENLEEMKVRVEMEDMLKLNPDLNDYVEDIAKWYDDHPDLERTPMETVYRAVKQAKTEDVMKKEEEARKAKEAEDAAKNASGGDGSSSGSSAPVNPFKGVMDAAKGFSVFG